MATFTQEEIDFIKERGNEHCRRIWLGLMNPNSPPIIDTKDEQKMKDLMSAKYELKRYYLDPSMASQNSNSSNQKSSQQSSNQTVVIPRVPHSRATSTALPSSTISAPKTNNNAVATAADVVNFNSNFSADFVADFSKVPDPFTTTTSTTNNNNTVITSDATPANRLNQPIVPQPFFANFDNNPVFDSRKNPVDQLLASPFNRTTGNSAMNANGTHVPPPEDRYAALKDLDSLMKQMKDDIKVKDNNTTTGLNASAWTATTNGSSGGGVGGSTYNNVSQNPIWGVGNQAANVISNPFATNDLWQPSANVVNNNIQSSIDTSLYNPVNPFKPVQFPINNDPQWVVGGGGGIGASSNGRDVIQFSELMTTTAATNKKVWQPTLPAYHANPFMVGGSGPVSNMTRNSNNPFL